MAKIRGMNEQQIKKLGLAEKMEKSFYEAVLDGKKRDAQYYVRESVNAYSSLAFDLSMSGQNGLAQKSYDRACSVLVDLPEAWWSPELERLHKDCSGCSNNQENYRKGVIEGYKRGKVVRRGLEKTTVTASVVGLVGGAFFLSSNLTGNVIGLSNTTSSWIGGILILIGLVALGFWIKSRKDSHKEKKVVSVKISKKVKSKKKK